MKSRFSEVFPQKNTLLAVVHSDNLDQTIRNVKIAVDNELHGVFLINHSMSGTRLLEIFRETRRRFWDIWMGINLLDFDMKQTIQSVNTLKKDGYRVDGIWTDNPEISGINPGFHNEHANAAAIKKAGWDGLLFGWVAFKHQATPENLAFACHQGQKYLDIITTSGPATGKPASIEKVQQIRTLSGNHPVGLASGVNHENIASFSDSVDIFIVASSLNKDGDFLNFDPKKVESMKHILSDLNLPK